MPKEKVEPKFVYLTPDGNVGNFGYEHELLDSGRRFYETDFTDRCVERLKKTLRSADATYL